MGKQPMLESACLAFDGTTNTACFKTYDGECLIPALRPGEIVVMDKLSCHKTLRDNLSCHETAEVVRLINSAGRRSATCRLQPGPQPDLRFALV